MRRLDWPERLAEEINAAKNKKFGSHYYCATFAADCVLAMTAEDLMPWRDLSEAEALHAMLDEYGGLIQALDAILGNPIPVAFAQRGDVLVKDEDNDLAIGVVSCNAQMGVYLAEAGITFRPTLEAIRAYRVR